MKLKLPLEGFYRIPGCANPKFTVLHLTPFREEDQTYSIINDNNKVTKEDQTIINVNSIVASMIITDLNDLSIDRSFEWIGGQGLVSSATGGALRGADSQAFEIGP